MLISHWLITYTHILILLFYQNNQWKSAIFFFRRTPIVGKHSKRIICGAWNEDNLLALGSEDKTLSISNLDGDTLRIVSLRADPSDMKFSEMKTDERVRGENTVSYSL